MKRTLTILAVASTVFATGCASTQEGSYARMIAFGYISPELAGEEAIKLGLAKRPKSPDDQAMENCQKIGYVQNTPEFRQCVVTTANSIRQARATAAAAEAARRASRQSSPDYTPSTTTCNQIGSSISCQTSRF